MKGQTALDTATQLFAGFFVGGLITYFLALFTGATRLEDPGLLPAARLWALPIGVTAFLGFMLWRGRMWLLALGVFAAAALALLSLLRYL